MIVSCQVRETGDFIKHTTTHDNVKFICIFIVRYGYVHSAPCSKEEVTRSPDVRVPDINWNKMINDSNDR